MTRKTVKIIKHNLKTSKRKNIKKPTLKSTKNRKQNTLIQTKNSKQISKNMKGGGKWVEWLKNKLYRNKNRTISETSNINDIDIEFENTLNTLDPGSESGPIEFLIEDVEIRHILGKGNFGTVNFGRLTHNCDTIKKVKFDIAIKINKTANNGNKEFLEECLLNNKIGDHINIISQYGIVSNENNHLMILEYCGFGALHDYIKSNDLSNLQLAKIGHDIAQGMAYLANKHIVHRDLAARNVLLTDYLLAKVSDFGLARIMNTKQNGGGDGNDLEYYRMSKEMPIPIRWTSPKSIEYFIFNEHSDMWSYGVTLIELYTKADRPYGTWSNNQVINEIKNGYRLSKPTSMPDNIYEIVKYSFNPSNTNDKKINSFNDIVNIFNNMEIITHNQSMALNNPINPINSNNPIYEYQPSQLLPTTNTLYTPPVPVAPVNNQGNHALYTPPVPVAPVNNDQLSPNDHRFTLYKSNKQIGSSRPISSTFISATSYIDNNKVNFYTPRSDMVDSDGFKIFMTVDEANQILKELVKDGKTRTKGEVLSKFMELKREYPKDLEKLDGFDWKQTNSTVEPKTHTVM